MHGTAGPHRGHIRATDDQIAADNNGHHRTAIGPAQQASLLPTAGRRDSPAVPDTEEVLRCRDERGMLIQTRGLIQDQRS
jgi:hypothetical protein